MDETALREICGAITSLAGELGCGLIDINGVTAGHPEAFRFDGVHPGTAGAALIAESVFEALSD
jgi:lysophospholipase L1-like esterase